MCCVLSLTEMRTSALADAVVVVLPGLSVACRGAPLGAGVVGAVAVVLDVLAFGVVKGVALLGVCVSTLAGLGAEFDVFNGWLAGAGGAGFSPVRFCDCALAWAAAAKSVKAA